MFTYDVVVVGGGIIGASCALALAEDGAHVVLLDRQTPGREASWAAGGMLSPAPHLPGDEKLTPLAMESLRMYPDYVRAIESASQKLTHYVCAGSIEVFFGPEGPAERDRCVQTYGALNVDVKAISATEARRMEPAIASSARSAAFFGAEATVEPRALMEATLEAARACGVEIRANAPVRSLIVERDRCAGVVTESERVIAGHVVIAAGCFSHEILGSDSYLGKHLATFVPTRPVRGQILALVPRDTTLAHVVRSSNGYLIPRSNGFIVAGSTLEEAGFDRHTTIEGLQKIRKAASELVPDLMFAEIGESWSGLRPGTPDGLPILGPIDLKGLILATGHFRNGILLAPVTARLVKEWVAHAPLSISADAYSPLRFAPKAHDRFPA